MHSTCISEPEIEQHCITVYGKHFVRKCIGQLSNNETFVTGELVYNRKEQHCKLHTYMDMQDVPCEVVVAFHLIVVLSMQSVIDNLSADNFAIQ